MAKTKKTETSSKKASSKTKTTKKETTKKHTAQPKKQVKTTKKTKKTHTNKLNCNWKSTALILFVIVLILSLAIYIVIMQKSTSKIENTLNNNLTQSNQNQSEEITLLILEDSKCLICQTSQFASQIKEKLIPNLKVEKIDISSERGQKLKETLKIKQVPYYFFSKNIDKRKDWETNLKTAFFPIKLENKDYYVLNPQLIPTKSLIDTIPITNNAVIIGNKSAPVTIIEFTDFECPYCAIAEGNQDLLTVFKKENPTYQPPMPSIYSEYIDTGKVKIVFYNLPIEKIHPEVKIAHLAALCANEQNKFKEYSHLLFQNRTDWIQSDRQTKLIQYAESLNLNKNQFTTCLETQKYQNQIDKEIQLAQNTSIMSTPTFVIGKIIIPGPQDFRVFKTIIDSELAKIN